MTDWIEEKAAQIKKKQEQAEGQRKFDLHETDVIQAQGRNVLEQLEAVVRRDVGEWNVHFQTDVARRIDSVDKLIPSGFIVRKAAYPSATLRTAFDPDSMSIQFVVTKFRARGEGEYSITGLFHIRLSEDGDIYLTNRSGEHLPFEDAARQLLEAVLDT